MPVPDFEIQLSVAPRAVLTKTEGAAFFEARATKTIDTGITVRVHGARAYALAVLAGVMVSLSACTSISWRGSDGAEYHLGLVACKVTKYADGQVNLSRHAIGLDAALFPESPAFVLGWHQTLYETPKPVDVKDWTRFGDLVAETMKKPLLPECPRTSWELFFYRDRGRAVAETARQTRQTVGVAINRNPKATRAALGYHSHQYAPAAIQNNTVLLERLEPKNLSPRLSVWRLIETPANEDEK